MRFSMLAALCLTLFISISSHLSAASVVILDPNADGAITAKVYAQTDPRLAQKVTYEAKFQSVQQILDDLREITGVKLVAGSRDSDWPVRSRMMNIFVHDVPLSDLMDSIARTMKFRWSRYDNVKPSMYRLKVNSKAAAEADAQKARAEQQTEDLWCKRRKEWLDIIMRDGTMSPSQVEATHESDPVFYRYARGGDIRALRALFVEVPEAKERFEKGQSFRISADQLSEGTRDLLFAAGDEFAKFMQRGRGPVIGFGDSIKPDDKFDIVYCRLDVDSFTPNLRWSIMTQGSTGYFHIARGENDWQIVSLGDKNSSWIRALCERENMIIDTDDRESANVILEASIPQLRADQKEEEESLYPSEPLNDHPNFNELKKTIKLKIEAPKTEQNPVLTANNYIASFQKALADETGMGVVSDSWVNIDGDMLPDQEATLNELLDKFSTQSNYNWDKADSILEFRHRKWAKMRLNQIPSEWVARWNQNTQDNGYLSLEDIAEIANLKYDQAEESLKMDKVLGVTGLYDEMLGILDANGNLIWLRLYSSLTARQRLVLMNNYGLNGFMLTSAQWELALPMFDRIGISRGEAIMRLVYTIDKDTNTFNASFKEIDLDSGTLDRIWNIDLPTYTSPAKEAQQ